jgi:hypothetical protein
VTPKPTYFFAAFTFAHRAFCAAAMRLRAAADIFRRGLTPLFPKTLPTPFSARTLAHRARVAAAILALPAADIWRFGPTVVSEAAFVLDTLLSPNNANTCCSLDISARTSLTMLSRLNVFPMSLDATGQDSTQTIPRVSPSNQAGR